MNSDSAHGGRISPSNDSVEVSVRGPDAQSFRTLSTERLHGTYGPTAGNELKSGERYALPVFVAIEQGGFVFSAVGKYAIRVSVILRNETYRAQAAVQVSDDKGCEDARSVYSSYLENIAGGGSIIEAFYTDLNPKDWEECYELIPEGCVYRQEMLKIRAYQAGGSTVGFLLNIDAENFRKDDEGRRLFGELRRILAWGIGGAEEAHTNEVFWVAVRKKYDAIASNEIDKGHKGLEDDDVLWLVK